MEIQVSPATRNDHPTLVEIWEASVRATHDFVTESDILEFRELVRIGLPRLQHLWVARDATASVSGFVGVSGDHVEMLFVRPERMGEGIGTHLMKLAIASLGVSTVDVNEQNPRAVEFYLRLGFDVFARSEQDGTGKPYPILHLKLL